MMFFACLVAPCFAVQAVMREQSGKQRFKRNAAVAVLDGPENILRVIACNDPAASRGAFLGMSKAQAEQLSSVILQKRSPEHEAWAQNALLECCNTFSPCVEPTASGVVTLEISGVERLFGTPEDIAATLLKCASATHIAVNVAIAANPDAAFIAAKGIPGSTVVPEGQEADYLSSLPLGVLSPTPEQMEIFESWGIRTCGELGELPSVPLIERLGQDGLRLQKLALGKVNRSLVPFEAPQDFVASLELEDAVELLDSLLFVINRLLEEVLAKLSTYSLSVSEVCLTLGLEENLDRDVSRMPLRPELQIFERTVKLPVPMQDRKILLHLIQLDLQAHPPNTGIKNVRVTVIPAMSRFTQGNLFVRSAPQGEKTELLQAKLRAVVGSHDHLGRNVVGTPCLIDSQLSDSFTVSAFGSPEAKGTDRPASQPEENLLRIFRPPKKAEVLLNRGKPARLSFAGLSANIKDASGPWKYSGQWWQERFEHEVWDVELSVPDGTACFRIYRDFIQNAWFVRGKFN